MASKPTIYDVAREAGVAASTVSRTFARPGRVSADTAQRVLAAAESIGYRATGLPGLGGTRTRSLALVVTDITNPFYSEVIRGAHDAAGKAGYTILLSHTQEDAQLERDWTERELAAVDGVLLASSRMSDSAIRMVAKQKPVILLNRRIPEVPCIITDNPRGARSAVQHLAELGHDRVTYVAGPEASWADGVRWHGVREAADELGLRVRRVGPCNVPTVHAGFTITSELLSSNPTAVIAYNDVLAIGILKGLRRAGRRVPEEVSVIGFDNIVLSEICEPELTTVAAPLRAQGVTGATNLIAVLGGAVPSREPIVLPVKLLVRGSTGRSGRGRTRPPAGAEPAY
jgi:LacI family transcriptional regulator